jgi:hypothetical protein
MENSRYRAFHLGPNIIFNGGAENLRLWTTGPPLMD